MSELASYKSVHAGDGWSPLGGQTVNVYVSLLLDGCEPILRIVGLTRFAWHELEW